MNNSYNESIAGHFDLLNVTLYNEEIKDILLPDDDNINMEILNTKYKTENDITVIEPLLLFKPYRLNYI